MRISPFALAAFIAALAALTTAAVAGEGLLPLALLSAAAALVAIAVLFQYSRPSSETPRVPIEDFSLWMDVGEPAIELRRLGSGNIDSAMKIVSADLGLLASNAGLLSQRLWMLVGRHGFDELTSEKAHRHAENLTSDLRAAIRKLEDRRTWDGEGIQQVLDVLEACASRADRIANKLYDFQREKPEIIRAYTEPLRRASEKLSRDLRLASANLSNYIKSISASPASA
jgi:DNA-directed RNA polymerase subunit F